MRQPIIITDNQTEHQHNTQMVTIDRNTVYESEGFSYRNFCTLDKKQLLMVLDWRNNPLVGSLMMNTHKIEESDHLAFVESLFSRDDKYYWLILKDGEPVGVLNVINVNREECSCEPGFYLAPDQLNKGLGIFVLNSYKKMLFFTFGFDRLYGHNYIENINALKLSLFFGASVKEIQTIDGREYFSLDYSKEAYIEYDTKTLIKDYVRFIRNLSFDISTIKKS